MYKEDFKGACLDMTTCPEAEKDESQCAKAIAMNSEPGKCIAVCTIGYSKAGHDSMKADKSCTADEKKQWDEAAENNQAGDVSDDITSTGGSIFITTACSITGIAVVVAVW